jgi:uncharacterized membrane protein
MKQRTAAAALGAILGCHCVVADDSTAGGLAMWTTDPDCTELACQTGGACIQPPSNSTCRCPSSVLPTCPPLVFQGVVVPENASGCWPRALSGDGSTIVGSCADAVGDTSTFMVWTQDTSAARVVFPKRLGCVATGVNFDGTVVVGIDDTGPVRIGKSGRERLPDDVVDVALNADGSVMVGTRDTARGSRAFMGTLASNLEDLGTLGPDDPHSYANAISADGNVVVGASGTDADPYSWRAVRWSAETGIQALPMPEGAVASQALRVNADGSVIIGIFYRPREASRVARWAGMRVAELPPLPPSHGGVGGPVSADGKLVAYIAGGDDMIALWDDVHGTRKLRDLLAERGADLSGWRFVGIHGGMSANGTVLVVTAEHESGDGRPRPVILRL